MHRADMYRAQKLMLWLGLFHPTAAFTWSFHFCTHSVTPLLHSLGSPMLHSLSHSTAAFARSLHSCIHLATPLLHCAFAQSLHCCICSVSPLLPIQYLRLCWHMISQERGRWKNWCRQLRNRSQSMLRTTSTLPPQSQISRRSRSQSTHPPRPLRSNNFFAESIFFVEKNVLVGRAAPK